MSLHFAELENQTEKESRKIVLMKLITSCLKLGKMVKLPLKFLARPVHATTMICSNVYLQDNKIRLWIWFEPWNSESHTSNHRLCHV